MPLDIRTSRLIAVGASIGANCQPCLQTNAARALADGVSEQEIAEAIAIGRMIRRGAASKMDQFVARLGAALPATEGNPAGGCGCSD